MVLKLTSTQVSSWGFIWELLIVGMYIRWFLTKVWKIGLCVKYNLAIKHMVHFSHLCLPFPSPSSHCVAWSRWLKTHGAFFTPLSAISYPFKSQCGAIQMAYSCCNPFTIPGHKCSSRKKAWGQYKNGCVIKHHRFSLIQKYVTTAAKSWPKNHQFLNLVSLVLNLRRGLKLASKKNWRISFNKLHGPTIQKIGKRERNPFSSWS